MALGNEKAHGLDGSRSRGEVCPDSLAFLLLLREHLCGLCQTRRLARVALGRKGSSGPPARGPWHRVGFLQQQEVYTAICYSRREAIRATSGADWPGSCASPGSPRLSPGKTLAPPKLGVG